MIDPAPRILIVYPSSSLDTNPTMMVLLESLAQRKVRVDVLAGQCAAFGTTEVFLAPEPFGEGVHVEYLPFDYFFGRCALRELPARLARRLLRWDENLSYPLRFDRAILKYLGARRYDAIIGVDPFGIVIAETLNAFVERPLVYVSFEILFPDDVETGYDAALIRMERAACRRTALALLQDDERGEIFCRETSIPPERVVTVPVAPPPQTIVKSDFLRRMLGIAPGKKIVLYCGNLQVWASRDELAEMVSYWPQEYCLVIHNRSTVQRTLQRFLDRLAETGKIFISAAPVGRKEMPALVASADFGLAPYKPVPGDLWAGNNLYHLGLASGKVSYYALCGLPILARPLPVFEREFASYDCGRIYRRLDETGDLLEEMSRNYEHHSREAVRFYRERLNPLPGIAIFCDRLLELARAGQPADRRAEA